MPYSLKPSVSELQTRKGTQTGDGPDMFHFCFLAWGVDVAIVIDMTVDVGHVAAVLVFVPVERQGAHFAILPRVDRFDGGLAPIKVLVRRVICWPIHEHNESFILGPDETLFDAVPEKVTEWVVI